MKMKLTLSNKLAIGFAAPVVIIFLLIILVYYSINSLLNANQWVDHTHKVIANGKWILSSMIDMETGMRGYLIAGDEVFLEPYYEGEQRFDRIVSELKKTVSDNPAQVAKLTKIEQMKMKWLNEAAKPQIELRQKVELGKETTDMNDVINFIEGGTGKRIMDEIRQEISEFVDVEKQLIVVRQNKSEDIADNTITIIIVGAVLFGLGSGIFAYLLISSVRRQVGGEPADMAKITRLIADASN